MTRASSTAATVLPMNVARPPASAAPPSTAAVMLLSANELPIWALPIGERAMTKSAATAPRTPESRSARTRIQLVLMPPRLAARSSKPTARTSRPGSRGVQPEIEQAGADDDDDERDRDRPDARPQERHQVVADDALGGGSHGQRDPVEDAERGQGGDQRRDLEAPDQHGVDQPERRGRRPGPRATPIRISNVEASPPIRNEPTTTPKLIIAPTDRSRYPTRSACVWAIAASASGIASSSIVVMLASVDEPVEPDLGVRRAGPRSAAPAGPPASTAGT